MLKAFIKEFIPQKENIEENKAATIVSSKW